MVFPNGEQRTGKKRHAIAQNIPGNISKQEKMANPLNTAISHETPVHPFYFALELGSALVWEYLCAEDISNLLRESFNGLSEKFVHPVSYVLDHTVGKDVGTMFTKRELQKLVEIQVTQKSCTQKKGILYAVQ
ncbi:Metal transporter [Phytophthora palmivora]|uniref:Metal transporter n=1 Tax=Phytophthora palmivora TaxID=4796 RepID=A0A2P4WZD2_9STRA|nr:Metal transporter [Phytophthora palmivora]